MRKQYNRQETINWMINSIMIARDDILDSNRNYIRQEYQSMDIDELVIEYEFYIGEFIFEIPSK